MLFCPLQKIDFKGDALKAFSLGDCSELAAIVPLDIPVFFHSGMKFSADILNKIKLVDFCYVCFFNLICFCYYLSL